MAAKKEEKDFYPQTSTSAKGSLDQIGFGWLGREGEADHDAARGAVDKKKNYHPDWILH